MNETFWGFQDWFENQNYSLLLGEFNRGRAHVYLDCLQQLFSQIPLRPSYQMNYQLYVTVNGNFTNFFLF